MTGRRLTHCHRGHPYDDANTYLPPGGGGRRHCRACMKVNARSAPSGAQRRKRRIARGWTPPPPTEAQRAHERERARRYDARRRAEGRIRPQDQAARRAKQLAFLHEYKLAHGCTDCGYREHPVALAFDHLPGFPKLGGLSQMLGCSETRILAEIAKCEVVCANCHAIRTYNRKREAKRNESPTIPNYSAVS
jgi:hypothetical protein